MNQLSAHSFNTVVADYLGKQLPNAMASALSFRSMPSDVQDFITRMLILMQKAHFPVTDFTPSLIWQLGNIIPGFLPCAWRGMVPPLTLSKRHAKIDAYVSKHIFPDRLTSPVFVDIGCGFPPITTMESAATLSEWRVFGVDQSFSDYLLHDREGNYACFNEQGEFEYFQPRFSRVGVRMYQNSAEVQSRFKKIFDELQLLLSSKTGQANETIDKDGYKLIHHPIRNYEAPNLSFVESKLEDVQTPPAHIIRCMNTLLYFKPETQQHMLVKLGSQLADGGMLIVGSNLMNGASCRYTVYKREGAFVVPIEFALTVDNLGPFNVMPWYTLHDNDPEAMQLADMIHQLRANQSFWPGFTKRLDHLMEHYGLFQRDGEGFFHAPEDEHLAADFSERVSHMWRQIEEEGLTNEAVDALQCAGYTAWKNPVGDIAIQPNAPSFKLPE